MTMPDLRRQQQRVNRAPVRRDISVNVRVTPPRPEPPAEKERPRQPEIEPTGGCLFMAFDYSETPEIADIYHVRGRRVTRVARHPDLQEYTFGSWVEKVGRIHYALFDYDNSGPSLFRSTNKGRSWSLSLQAPANGALPPSPPVEGPDGTHWFVTWAEPFKLFKSSDRGLTWNVVHTFSEDFAYADVISVAVSPLDPDLLVCWGEQEDPSPTSLSFSNVGVSTNGGVTFARFTLEDDDVTVSPFKNVAFLPSGRALVAYERDAGASAPVRVAYSDDPASGDWTIVTVATPSPEFDVVCDPGFGPLQVVGPSTVYLGGNACWSDNQIRIWRSSDGGETWSPFVAGVTGQNEGGRYFIRRRHLYLSNAFNDTMIGEAPILLRRPLAEGGEWETLLTGDVTTYPPAFAQAVTEL